MEYKNNEFVSARKVRRWNDICEIVGSGHSVMRFAQGIASEVGDEELLEAIKK